jgi:hypothetical protein
MPLQFITLSKLETAQVIRWLLGRKREMTTVTHPLLLLVCRMCCSSWHPGAVGACTADVKQTPTRQHDSRRPQKARENRRRQPPHQPASHQPAAADQTSIKHRCLATSTSAEFSYSRLVMPVSTRSSVSHMKKNQMSGDNIDTPSHPTSKKARSSLQSRITNLAVPIRLHIYGFLNENDIKLPPIYGDSYEGEGLGPIYDLSRSRYNKPYTIETAFACMVGDYDSLQYLQGMPSNDLTVENCNRNQNVSNEDNLSKDDIQAFFYMLYILIVGYNNIKTLRFARQMLLPWNQWALDAGIRHGVDLPILKWMYKEGCPYSEDTLGVAASWRNTDVLDWLHSINCPMSEWSFNFAIEYNCPLGNFSWLTSHGCPWNKKCLPSVLDHDDNLPIFQYLLAKKFPWTNATLRTVINSGDVSHLKLLREANIIFRESHFHQAIREHRPIEFLQYLLQCLSSSWDARTFSLAVKGGDLSILKWLKAEGCAWDASVFITAIKKGNREIIRWLYKEKCPMNETAMDDLMEKFVFNRYEGDEDYLGGWGL